MTTRENFEAFFESLSEARGNPGVGHNANRFIESLGGTYVINEFNEPDPITFRGDYYYNTRINQLFKKLVVGDVNVWKRVSDIQGDD